MANHMIHKGDAYGDVYFMTSFKKKCNKGFRRRQSHRRPHLFNGLALVGRKGWNSGESGPCGLGPALAVFLLVHASIGLHQEFIERTGVFRIVIGYPDARR